MWRALGHPLFEGDGPEKLVRSLLLASSDGLLSQARKDRKARAMAFTVECRAMHTQRLPVCRSAKQSIMPVKKTGTTLNDTFSTLSYGACTAAKINDVT